MRVRLTFTEELLGTASANPKIYEEFLGSKCADKEKVKAEMESLGTEDLVEKTMTVFHRKDGVPILYDYQIRGFIKEALGVVVEFTPLTIGGKKTTVKDPKTGESEDVVKGGSRISKNTYKRFVDNYIFVTPREIGIQIPDGRTMGTCSRPLRADTLQGPRVALAHSETAPVGTVIEFAVVCTQPKLEQLVIDALNYGALKGIGQWRNSGKGRFVWEEVK